MTTLIVVYCPRCDYFRKIAVQVVGSHGRAHCNGQMEVYVAQESAARGSVAPRPEDSPFEMPALEDHEPGLRRSIAPAKRQGVGGWRKESA